MSGVAVLGRWFAVAALAATAGMPPSPTVDAQVRFVDRSAELGVTTAFAYGAESRPFVTDSGGAGAAWFDYDVDGRLDLLTLTGLPGPSDRPAEATAAALAGAPLEASLLADGTLARHALFRNGSAGFRRAPAGHGLDEAAWTGAAAVADIDDDGFADVLVTAIGPNRLYRNNGDGSFSPLETGLEHGGWGTGAAWVDLDADGLLDLYLTNYVDFDARAAGADRQGACAYLGLEVFCGPRGLPGESDVLFRNQGDLTWRPWPGSAADPDATYGFAVLPTDCDGDGTPEIYVANDSNINLLYRMGGGGLEDMSLLSGAGYSGAGLEQAGMGIAGGDIDGDGDFDLVVSNFQRDYETVYRNEGDCSFLDVTPEVGLAGATYPYMAWAALLADFDGDTDLDLFVANGHIYPQVESAGLEPFGQEDQLFLNRLAESGRASFELAPEGGGPALTRRRPSRAAAFGDADGDGDLDLVVTYLDAPPAVLLDEADPPAAFLRLTLVGRGSNRSAYGARIEVHSGETVQRVEHRHGDGYLGSNDPRRLFVLPTGRAERVTIRWPGGSETVLEDLAAGSIVVHEDRGVIARSP